VFRLLHPVHVSRPTDQEQACEDLLNERADLRKRQPWTGAGATAFALEKREGDRADHHVVLPSRIRAALEMIEAEFGFEILIVLFDRPALMRQVDELGQRGRRRQRDEVVFAAPGRAPASFAQQPNFWGQPSLPPIGRRRDPPGGEVGFPRGIGPVRGEFPIVLQNTPEKNSRSCDSAGIRIRARFTQALSARHSTGQHREDLGSCRRIRHPHVTPPSASDTAHDSAAASDTN